jgi:tRNA-2-methylthio-N6-dimethylallyladenosine synthase
LAGRKMEDDVTDETKARRLQEIVDLQQKHAWSRSEEIYWTKPEVLVEKVSKNLLKNFRKKTKHYSSFPKENYKIGTCKCKK